jgi:hypothetical protein
VSEGARLISDLLVAKGDASPTGGFAHVGADLSRLLPLRAKLDAPRGDPVPANGEPGARAGRVRSPKRGNGAAKEPRVALTLRLDRERHRCLKTFCARSERTIQSVLARALDAYLEACGADCASLRGAPEGCARD